MSRTDRLREYAAMKGPRGENTKENLAYWSNRASENSEKAPRARSSAIKLPEGGTGVGPKRHEGDMRARAKAEKNIAGDTAFMPGVRRGTN